MIYRILKDNTGISILEFFDFIDKFKDYPKEQRIAVFDFDNTLIHGDIGEAIFARMIKNKKQLNYSWTEYTNSLQENDTQNAYKRLISSYENTHKDTLISYTDEVFQYDKNEPEYISFYENGKFFSVMKPMPNKIFTDIILKLQSIEFKIFIISASSDISVKHLGYELFNIPKNHIFGMKNKYKDEENKILGFDIELPAPCFEGKAELYQKLISKFPPLLTAGDSENDIAFMNLTSEDGIRLIMNKIEDDKDEFDTKINIFKDSFEDDENIFTLYAKI